MLRSTITGYELGPNGIARPQLRLREALAHSDFATALGTREDDELLRALNVGVSSFYASQYARSAAVLDSAALLADDRITRSVSKEGLALVTSDLARPYQARRTERLFIPYYAMLSYARLGQWEDAAVEARRLGALLLQYASDQTAGERPTHAMMHYLAGSVLERAGDVGEAQVSYRLARATAPDMVDSLRPRISAGQGELLVVIERGFVAHRATEAMNVFFGDDDGDSTRSGRGDRRRRRNDDDDDDGYWLSVAFPALRRSARLTGDATVELDSTIALGSRVVSLTDDASLADEQRERTAMIARATTRAVAKYVVTKAVKDRKGDVAGQIANIGLSLLERADVRSWHLLPQAVTLVRAAVPAGAHALRVAVGGGEQDLGTVDVRAGQLTVVTVRLWEDPSPRTFASH